MTYSGASCSSAARRQRAGQSGLSADAISSTTITCCATENACGPLVWPFQRATRASPCAMSSISMSAGDGSSRSRRRPDSMRCQARGAGGGNAFVSWSVISGSFSERRRNESALKIGANFLARARDQMIVDHAGRLHEGIHGGRADKTETRFLQRFRQQRGFIRYGRNFADGATRRRQPGACRWHSKGTPTTCPSP